MQLPGLARALVSAGQLSEATAREVALKATASKSSFVAQLVSSGHFSAAELAHQISLIFSTPLLDLNAIDPLLLPKDLLDPKLCTSHHVLPLCKRGNRLIVATAAPTDKEATEKIKFASQMGIDWIIAEHDKLVRLIESAHKSVTEALDTYIADDEFQFDDIKEAPQQEDKDSSASDVEDAPVVKFLHKMLIDAVNMRASDLHFEPYEHNYRVRFRVDGELREIASPPIAR